MELDLSDNLLSGSIPFSIGSLTKLDQLKLNDNDLTGTVPSSFTALVAADVDCRLDYLQLDCAAVTTGLCYSPLCTTTTTTTTTTGTCGTCQGLSCDRQTESNGATCEYMERELNCDCSWCECPTDCFDVYDLEKGNGTCAYYAENDFCNSYFCEDCIYAGLCDYSCHFGNCDTTTTTTTTTTDIDTTTQFVSTTRALYFENIYPNTKTTCNNIYKIEAVCTGTSPCSLRECWVCSSLFPGPVASCSLWLLIHYLGTLRR